MFALRKKTREARKAKAARTDARAEENAAGIVTELKALTKGSTFSFNTATKEGVVTISTNIATKNSPRGLQVKVTSDGDMEYDGARHPVCPEFDKDFLGESFRKFHARRNLYLRRPRMTKEAVEYVTQKAKKAGL